VETFPVALAIFVVLFFSTESGRGARRPGTPDGGLLRSRDADAGRCLGLAAAASDRAVGRSGPQAPSGLPAWGLHGALRAHTDDGHVPHLRPHQGSVISNR